MKHPGPELVWAGKRRQIDTSPPPRLETLEVTGTPGTRNRLIRADNRIAMRALLPELAGQVDLAYLDPPFGTGGSFLLTRRGSGGTPGVAAYTDRWNPDLTDYLSTMLEQLELCRALLSEHGTIFVHCDWHVSHHMRCLLDEVFGPASFKNEIVWRYRRWPARTRVFQRMHDVIFWYGKSAEGRHRWTPLYEPLAASTVATWGTKRQVADFSSGRRKPSQTDQETAGAPMCDVWDIGIIAPIGRERVGYPTQKPEALLRRVIEAASHPGDLVADFFAGSGTTLAVAQQLGRRWIGCDQGHAAIHLSRKRLLALQAPFEVQAPQGAFDDNVPSPSVRIRAERLADPYAVRLCLEQADAVDHWAVDWHHEGHVLDATWHASRAGKQRAMPLTTQYTYTVPGAYHIAVQVIGVNGGERREVLRWEVFPHAPE